MDLDLRSLARINPPAADAMAIELVNSLTVAGDIIRFRASRGWTGRLLDHFSSRDLTFDESVGSALMVLSTLLADLENDVVLTEMGVATVANAVTTLQADAKRLSAKTSQLDSAMEQIAAVVDKLQARTAEVERRLAGVELRVQAREVIDRVLAAWKAGRAYAGLPWLLQVTFLAREVCSSRAVAATFASGSAADLEHYITDSIDAHLQLTAPTQFSLASAIDEVLAPLDEDALVLFQAVTGQAAPGEAPMLAALTLSAKMCLVAERARPPQPAWCAIDLLKGDGSELRYVVTRHEFIGAVLREWRRVAERAFVQVTSTHHETAALPEQRLLTSS